METEERRRWRQAVREALRPAGEYVRPSRQALIADAVLALLMAACAVIALYHVDAGRQIVGVPPDAPVLPGPVPPLVHSISVAIPPEPRQILLALLTALPLAARRRYPLAAFWVVALATMANPDWATPISLLAWCIAAYSAIVHSRNLVPAIGSFALAAMVASRAFHSVENEAMWSGWFVLVPVLALAWAVARHWQTRLKASQERLEAVRREQEEATRRAVEEERSRIAAELHDVVTHNVSVMVIQAGAARTVMDSAPELAKEALLAVEAGGRAAMAELRHVMGLLAASGTGRAEHTEEELEPQPGLGQLDGLVQRIRAAGLPVTLAVSLPADPLPPGVDLTAYRVVQEALTNTLKHAAGSSAAVTIGHQAEWLEIEVTDTGGSPSPQAATGNGRGLIGLRERLALYGGTLDAGRRIGGGHRINARLRWRTA